MKTQQSSNATIEQFQQLIWNFYKTNKRQFPWRETKDPYKIMVSELMLQQTQTFRVVPKYNMFLAKFPIVNDLAKASLTDVLSLWIGLGYNRRAKFLHQAALYITETLQGEFPKEQKQLIKIPGIGPYTSAAIIVFAFNIPHVFIETNIRRVFIHHFFPNQENITDRDLFPLIKQSLDQKNPREWYYALMDYGSELKNKVPNPNRQSKHYAKQSKFAGSIRKIRGEIIRQLLKNPKINEQELLERTEETKERFNQALDGLISDKLINKENQLISLK